jgi:hypothetical protein
VLRVRRQFEAGKTALDRRLSSAPSLPHPRTSSISPSPSLPAAPAPTQTLKHGLTNALIESVNTKIRLITRVAFGFRSVDALIALAMFSLAGHRSVQPCYPVARTHGAVTEFGLCVRTKLGRRSG